jgi:nitrous-oxide reductase
MFPRRISSKVLLTAAVLVTAAVLAVVIAPKAITSAQGSPTDWQTIAQQRGLTEADMRAAAMTYTPSGVMDEYVMFASAGQGGQVLAIGMPSMRLLRLISVFTPESWQGYGYGAGNEVLEQGYIDGQEILWGDTHHPALSETNGEYDGQWLFIGDKANGRVAVIDLRDFETKQIVHNPAYLNDHGGTFVTPNTEYIVCRWAEPMRRSPTIRIPTAA